MSYYRPAHSALTRTIPSPMIEVAQEPAPVTYAKAATIDKVITEVVSAGVQTKTETHVQPVVMRKEGLDAAKKRRQAAVRSINNPLEMCFVGSDGTIPRCPKPHSRDSVYCVLHACQAYNADGMKCDGGVTEPSKTRFCENGYHEENGRHSYLEDLYAVRREHDIFEASEKENERLQASMYFSTHFQPMINASPTSSASGSNSPSSRDGRSNSSDRGCNDWDIHHIDKWWEGEWKLQTTPISPEVIKLGPARDTQ